MMEETTTPTTMTTTTPTTAREAADVLTSDPNFDASALEWRRQKSLGAAAFRENRLPEALKHFGFAIELLPLTETEEMAKLFTNCATTYYKISELLPEKGPSVEKSLRAALKAVALNPKWWKGHFCAARCLLHQNKKSESLVHMRRVLELNVDAERDVAVAEILRGLEFFEDRASVREGILAGNPALSLVRFKDNVFLIDAGGAGHFRTLSEALDKKRDKVSFIVAPGVYNLDDGIKLQGSDDVDIVGSPGSNPDEVVIFESNATGNNNMIFVAKATLTLTNAILRVTSPRAAGNVIRVRQAGKVALNRCQASTWSQNRPAILVMNGSLIAEEFRITNAVNTGVAVMTGGYVKMRRSEIRNAKVFGVWISGEEASVEFTETDFVNCGQSVATTSGAKGLTAEGCRFDNAALFRLKSKCSGVALDCGVVRLLQCRLTTPGVFGVVARGVCDLGIDRCSIEGCRSVGVGLTGGVVAGIVGNKIRRCGVGVAVQRNEGARVVLDHNVLQECVDKVRILSEADAPTTEGPQHKFVVGETDFDDPNSPWRSKTTTATANSATKSTAKSAAKTTEATKQKAVDEMKNALNQTKPVDEYFSSGGNKERRCANCQKVEDEKENRFKFCSSCRMACYCTPQCQKMGWKAHKKVCHKLADARKKVEEISSQMDKKRKELAIINDLSEKVGEAEELAKEQLQSGGDA